MENDFQICKKKLVSFTTSSKKHDSAGLLPQRSFPAREIISV